MVRVGFTSLHKTWPASVWGWCCAQILPTCTMHILPMPAEHMHILYMHTLICSICTYTTCQRSTAQRNRAHLGTQVSTQPSTTEHATEHAAVHATKHNATQPNTTQPRAPPEGPQAQAYIHTHMHTDIQACYLVHAYMHTCIPRGSSGAGLELTPTSITVAPGLIHSPLIISAAPTAAGVGGEGRWAMG